MKTRSVVAGVILVVAVVLVEYTVQAQNKPRVSVAKRRRRSTQPSPTTRGRRSRMAGEFFASTPSAAKPFGARPSSFTEPSPARRTEVSATA